MNPYELAEKVKGSKACYVCLVVGHTEEKYRIKERLICTRCVKRGVNDNHSFLLCKHRVVDRPEKEPSLNVAAIDEDDLPVEGETEPSSS